MRVTRFLTKLAARSAANQILRGRLIDRERPERGRFLQHDVDAFLAGAWRNVDAMLPAAELDRIPTLGNRQNAFFAVVTVAAYRALLEAGAERPYAIELFADIGWKLYERIAWIPNTLARLLTRDPQRRINLTLRILMLYPFRSPGPPGYAVRAWAERDRFCTDWSHCPPFEVVKHLIAKHGDEGDLEAFRRSWCTYDWALAYAMVDGGFGRLGHYERPLTLSKGDEICQMRWYARPPRSERETADSVR